MHKKLERKLLIECNNFLKPYSGKASVISGGKHFKLLININGKTKFSPISNMEKDDDHLIKIKLRDLRKMMDEFK